MTESADTLTANEDEQRRRFRAALERKKAQHNETRADGARDQGIAEAQHDKQVRQFRRKSGS